MLAIRPASLDDVDFLISTQQAPHTRGLLHAATPDQIVAALSNPERSTLIITDDGASVGMLLLAHEADSPWLVELRRIVVMMPERGIGAFAVAWAITWSFEELGAHRIWLEVVESNLRARRVYERAGFRLEGTYRDGFRDKNGRYANLCVYGLLKRDIS